MAVAEEPDNPDYYRFYTSSMFRHAPFTKFWLITLITCSLGRLTYEHFAGEPKDYWNMADVTEGKILHLLYSPFVASDFVELIISAALIYFYRVIERRYGTKKYINCLISTLITSQLIRYIILKVAHPSVAADIVPFHGSPLIVASAVYCYFISEIPVFSRYLLAEFIPLSDHHFILFIFAQFFSTFTVLHFIIPGILSSLIYCNNLFFIQKLSYIPEVVASQTRNPHTIIGSWIKIFENFLESQSFKPLPVAATLERQRIEEEDELQKQIMQQQLGQRNILFRGVHRVQGPPPEVLIRSLCDMGFANRQEVIQALQETDNNLEVAANLLLQRNFS